ncbi:MAG TPA: hypothetical protein VHL34_24415 [Rhizomicrobium sp.]|jgi:hypothetical protein|nr:hypothetical protein [Rhizomicrobium sp.]
MKRFSIAIALSAALLPAAAAPPAFHPPKSSTEIVLDRMIHRADADDNQLSNLLRLKWADHKLDYTTLLTPRLIAQLIAEEKAMVERDCGGVYKDGEICGFDYSPIGCDQDYAPHYLYRTLSETPDKAVIAYAWPESDKADATYTLVKSKVGWRIDSVVCSNG